MARQIYEQIASQCGDVGNDSWRQFLNRVRMLFIHTAAPSIAVDVSCSHEGVFDFLIMSENIKDFARARPDSFLPLIRDMNQIWNCLQAMAQAIEEILIDRISKLQSSKET